MDSLFSFALFSPSLPFLRLPHRLPLIVFFVIEIWQSGRSRPPASCQLTRDMRRLHADYTQITRRLHADYTHNAEKSKNRTPRVVRITFVLFGSFLLLCSAVPLRAVVSPGWTLR